MEFENKSVNRLERLLAVSRSAIAGFGEWWQNDVNVKSRQDLVAGINLSAQAEQTHPQFMQTTTIIGWEAGKKTHNELTGAKTYSAEGYIKIVPVDET